MGTLLETRFRRVSNYFWNDSVYYAKKESLEYFFAIVALKLLRDSVLIRFEFSLRVCEV